MLVPAAGALGIPGDGGPVPAAVRALGAPAAAVLPGKVPVHGGARPARRAWTRCGRRGPGRPGGSGGERRGSGGERRGPAAPGQYRAPLAQPLDSIPAAGRSNQCSAWLGRTPASLSG